MHTYRAYGRSRVDFYTLSEWLNNREAFTGSNFRGHPVDTPAEAIGVGQLAYVDPEWARTFEARRNAGVIDYVVYSYRTPIAWHDTEAGWVQPDVRYSNTTTRHQSAVRVAVSVIGAANAA